MESIAELKELISNNSLFNQMTDTDLERLLDVVAETRTIPKGSYLIQESDDAEEVYLVKEGEFEVLKRENGSETMHRLAVIKPGMSVGEVSLLDRGPRSASIRALQDSSVLVIPIDDLEELASVDKNIGIQMKVNLAYEMGRRLRVTNENTVRTLREKLDEAEKRAEMGRFMSRVLIGTCLYMFALGTTKALSQYLPDTTLVTIPILMAFAVGLIINIKTSAFPASAYGFTTKNWRPALKEAFIFSLPIVGIIILVKYILILNMPSMEGAPIFDLYQSKNSSLGMALLMALFYACFAPVQEMIARSGMQSSFQMFLTGKHKTALSIVLSTLLFSSTHLHVSLTLALLVFPLGLFWGWLYSRHPTLIGVSASHVALGLFGLFIVGFPMKG